MRLIDLVGTELRFLQRRLEGLLSQRHVAGLAEALLPDLRTGIAGTAPAVDELFGGGRAREMFRDDVRAVADQQR